MQSVDFGPKTSGKVVDAVRTSIKRGKVKSGDDIRKELQGAIKQLIADRGGPNTELRLGADKPNVIMVVGVNGSGKTTTIGKLAAKLREQDVQVSKHAGGPSGTPVALRPGCMPIMAGTGTHTHTHKHTHQGPHVIGPCGYAHGKTRDGKIPSP